MYKPVRYLTQDGLTIDSAYAFFVVSRKARAALPWKRGNWGIVTDDFETPPIAEFETKELAKECLRDILWCDGDIDLTEYPVTEDGMYLDEMGDEEVRDEE